MYSAHLSQKIFGTARIRNKRKVTPWWNKEINVKVKEKESLCKRYLAWEKAQDEHPDVCTKNKETK